MGEKVNNIIVEKVLRTFELIRELAATVADMGDKVESLKAETLAGVMPRILRRSGFIKLIIDQTKADGSTDTESAQISLPEATESLAGVMPSQAVQKLNTFTTLPDITLQVKSGDVVYRPATSDHAAVLALCRAVVDGTRLLGRIIINNVSYTITNTSTDLQGSTRSVKLYLSWIEPTQTNTRLRTAKVVLNCVPGTDEQEAIDATGNIVLRPIVLRQIDMNTGENLVLDMPAIASLPSGLHAAEETMAYLAKLVADLRRDQVVARVTPADARLVVFNDGNVEDFHLIEAVNGIITRSQIPEGYDTCALYDFETIEYLDLRGFKVLRTCYNFDPVTGTAGAGLPPRRYTSSIIEGLTNMDDLEDLYNWDGFGSQLTHLTAIRGKWNTSSCRLFGHLFGHFWPWAYDKGPLTEIPEAIDTSAAEVLDHMFIGLPYINRFPDLDLSSALDIRWLFAHTSDQKNIKDYMGEVRAKAFNLGAQKKQEENFGHFEFTLWNREDMLDTLLHHSFDRKKAGFPALKINMNKTDIARLTTEEKAAITAKGFTLAGSTLYTTL